MGQTWKNTVSGSLITAFSLHELVLRHPSTDLFWSVNEKQRKTQVIFFFPILGDNKSAENPEFSHRLDILNFMQVQP